MIKGGTKGGDDAVLCTDDRTFALKYVETTNTLLLLPPDQVGSAAARRLGGVPGGMACLRAGLHGAYSRDRISISSRYKKPNPTQPRRAPPVRRRRVWRHPEPHAAGR